MENNCYFAPDLEAIFWLNSTFWQPLQRQQLEFFLSIDHTKAHLLRWCPSTLQITGLSKIFEAFLLLFPSSEFPKIDLPISHHSLHLWMCLQQYQITAYLLPYFPCRPQIASCIVLQVHLPHKHQVCHRLEAQGPSVWEA